MRLKTQLFLIWGCFALVLWAGASVAVQHTLSDGFTHLSAESMAQTRQGVRAMQDERINRMRQVSSVVMNSPELRALIAEHSSELSADNLSSLQERLNSMAKMLDAGFVCVLDNRGLAIAQSSGSPWQNTRALQLFLNHENEARAMVQILYQSNAAGADDDLSGTYGLWAANGQLLQTVGVPLIFDNDGGEKSASASPDGALIVGVPITDAQAKSLASTHGCDLTFLLGSKIAATSVNSPRSRRDISSLAVNGFGTSAAIGDVECELSSYSLVDPISQQDVGTVLIQSDQAEAMAVRGSVSRNLLLIFCAGLLAVAYGSYLLSRRITRPIAELLQGAQRVGEGDLSMRLEVRQKNELGEMAREFNNMVSQIGARRELERQIEESRAASRAKNQFLANMSHEIRTPLNGVIGMADLLLGTQLSERQYRYASLVKASAEVLTTLINDALDFAKIESGKMELESIDFDLHAMVEDVTEMFAPRAMKKGLTISCDIRGDTPLAARGDPSRLRQVLLNLVNNAIKFTERGEIVVSAAPHAEIPGAVRFAVRDTGPGIPADRQNRLFQAFTQVDASTTRRFGGTGLGLAISRQLVDLMGGKIGFETQVGHGSEFWFTANLAPAEKLTVAPAINIEPAGTPVLVADANETTRRTLKARIEERGGAVTEAKSMDEIAAADNRPNLNFRWAFVGSLAPAQSAMDSASAAARILNAKGTTVFCITPPDAAAPPGDSASHGLAGYLPTPIRRTQLDQVLTGQTAPAVNTTATAASARRSVRILLADDHEVNQLLVVDLLEQAGYRCDAVGDGAAAVKRSMTGEYGIILMDCQMPEMDGYDATQAIRRREIAGGPNVKRMHIIALTANVSESDRRRCLEAGMDDYCPKPIKRDQLLQTIERVAPSEASPAQPAADSPAEKAVDLPTVLGRCSGKAALAEKVLGKLIDHAKQVVESAAADLRAQNFTQVQRTAHGLKGTAGMAAVGPLQKAAEALESVAGAGDAAAAEAALSFLRQEVARCEPIVQEALSELAGMSREAIPRKRPQATLE